jgi:hypothetical protein
MNLSTIAAMENYIVANLNSQVFHFLTAQQISQFHNDTCFTFSVSQMAQIPFALDPEMCTGFQPDCVAYFNIDVLEILDWGCINDIPAKALKTLTAYQVYWIKEIWGLTNTTLSALNGSSCAGFTADQVSDFAGLHWNIKACGGLTPECMQNILPSSLVEFPVQCAQYLPLETVAVLSQDQVAQLPVTSITS